MRFERNYGSLFFCHEESNVDLSGADNYLAFFAGALEYSVLPRARRPARAESLGMPTRTSVWDWVSSQVHSH